MARDQRSNINDLAITGLKIGAGLFAGWWLWDKIFKADSSGGQSHNLPPQYIPENLTYPIQNYMAMADAIETAIFGGYAIVSPWEDDEAVANILLMMQNNDDVWRLIEAYGLRGVGIIAHDRQNLPGAITEYLDDNLKNEVNDVYRERGIPFQW